MRSGDWVLFGEPVRFEEFDFRVDVEGRSSVDAVIDDNPLHSSDLGDGPAALYLHLNQPALLNQKKL